MAVSSLLNNELKIDTNNKSNPNFLNWLAWMDMLEQSMIRRETAHQVALLVAMNYWTGILDHEATNAISEAKLLKPRIETFLEDCIKSGELTSKTRPKVQGILKTYVEEYRL